MFLSRNVVNSFWPTVKSGLESNGHLSQIGELFFNPRLTALIHRLLGILLLMAKHLERLVRVRDKRNVSTFSHVSCDISYHRDSCY